MNIVSRSFEPTDYLEHKLKQTGEVEAKIKGFKCIQLYNLHPGIQMLVGQQGFSHISNQGWHNIITII